MTALGRCWWTKKKEKRKMGREAARQKLRQGREERREREIDSGTSWTEYYQFISSIDDDDDESLAVGRSVGWEEVDRRRRYNAMPMSSLLACMPTAPLPSPAAVANVNTCRCCRELRVPNQYSM